MISSNSIKKTLCGLELLSTIFQQFLLGLKMEVPILGAWIECSKPLESKTSKMLFNGIVY